LIKVDIKVGNCGCQENFVCKLYDNENTVCIFGAFFDSKETNIESEESTGKYSSKYYQEYGTKSESKVIFFSIFDNFFKIFIIK
jgi:hypothetical protein